MLIAQVQLADVPATGLPHAHASPMEIEFPWISLTLSVMMPRGQFSPMAKARRGTLAQKEMAEGNFEECTCSAMRPASIKKLG